MKVGVRAIEQCPQILILGPIAQGMAKSWLLALMRSGRGPGLAKRSRMGHRRPQIGGFVVRNIPSARHWSWKVHWAHWAWTARGFGAAFGHLGPVFYSVVPSLAPSRTWAIRNGTGATDWSRWGFRGPNGMAFIVLRQGTNHPRLGPVRSTVLKILNVGPPASWRCFWLGTGVHPQTLPRPYANQPSNAAR